MSTAQNKSMVRPWGKVWMVVMAALLIALVTGGMRASMVFASSSSMLPFQASIAGTVALTGPTTAVLSGSGIATYLGVIKYAGNVSDITATPTGMTNVVVETLTAPNGDTLTTLCTEVAVQTSPGVFNGTDQWVVTGGTGQYAGATGSGTGNTLVNLNTGTWTKQLTGAISIPNGK